MSLSNPVPGGKPTSRPLHFIWICDCSGSMVGDKIQALNNAIRECIPHMQEAAAQNIGAEVRVRAVTFSSGAQWHISQPVSVESFTWNDVSADGPTDMGQAMKLVAEQLKCPPMEDRALPPVLVLLSDGQPTDDFKGGLKELMAIPWGRKTVRIAIAIGSDADRAALQEFIGNSELKPLEANNPEQLVKWIKWVSTVVLKAASAPASQPQSASPLSTPIPIPPPPSSTSSTIPEPGDVW